MEGGCLMKFTIGLVLVLLFVGLIVYIISLIKSVLITNKNKQELLGKSLSNEQKNSFLLSKYAARHYSVILSIPGIKNIVLKIRKKYENLAKYDEFTMRREIMKIVYAIFSFVLLTILLLLVIRPSFKVVFWIAVAILLVSGIMIDFFVYRVEIKLLTQLKAYINRVRFNYQETKMIEEASIEAIPTAGPEMKAHAERIDKIINSDDTEEELERYEEVAPSRYLRVVAALMVLVKERGDNIQKDKGSSLLKGLTAINKELNSELLYRSRLRFAMRMLPTLAVFPIFIAKPIENYVKGFFPATEIFFSSKSGFYLEILLYATCIGIYLWLRKMREVSEANYQNLENKTTGLKKLMNKYPIIEKLAMSLGPKKDSAKYNELEQLLKDANDKTSIEEHTLKKFLIGTISFVLLVIVFTYAHVREVNTTLNTMNASQNLYVSSYKEEELEKAEQINQFDRDMIEKLESLASMPTPSEFQHIIAEQLGTDDKNLAVYQAYNRIMSKWSIVNNAYLKWWEVATSLIIALLLAQIPTMILYYKRNMRKKIMESEVYQLLVIISILRDFEGMSIDIILEWLVRFSVAFKEPFLKALQELDGGAEQALENLEEEIAFEPILQIIARLKLTVDRLSIEESFDDIDVEREFYYEQRLENQAREIIHKENLGELIVFVPIFMALCISLILPILYVAFKESSNVMNML
jgi:hypothetical protein